MAGAAGSEFSSGGMKTKIDAAKIATSGGAHMVIASGKIEHPLRAIEQGGRCTWFLASATPSAARKRWIAGGLAPRGSLYLDDGAVKALRSGKSLLPAGVTRVDGDFDNGDAVVVRDAAGMEIGRGLVGCDASEARKIMGKNSAAIEAELGVPFRGAMIHRDDLVVTG
jgi:glutamate 5-kinase